jgi:hypothetical protein
LNTGSSVLSGPGSNLASSALSCSILEMGTLYCFFPVFRIEGIIRINALSQQAGLKFRAVIVGEKAMNLYCSGTGISGFWNHEHMNCS